MADKVIAPRGLRAATRRWFEAVAADFVLESHHLRLLQLAAESWDTSREARETLSREGLTILDRFGQTKAHPLVAVERDAAASFRACLRELALDLEPPKESRPPAVRPPYLRKA